MFQETLRWLCDIQIPLYLTLGYHSYPWENYDKDNRRGETGTFHIEIFPKINTIKNRDTTFMNYVVKIYIKVC